MGQRNSLKKRDVACKQFVKTKKKEGNAGTYSEVDSRYYDNIYYNN